MKRFLSFIVIVSLVIGACFVIPVQAVSSVEEMMLLGNNSALNWKTYSSECEAQEIKIQENVAVRKLRLKITGVYTNYYKIREFEVLDENGNNILFDAMTKRKVTVSYEGGMPGDSYNRVCDGIIGEDVVKPYYERTEIGSTELQNEYIEFTFAEPVNISSVRLWCNWCKQNSFFREKGDAPKTWEVYGDNVAMFYEGFSDDLSYWSASEDYSIANGAVMPTPNKEAIMYTKEEFLKNYRAEAEVLGLSGKMGLISQYVDEDHCYRAILDKSKEKVEFYKGTRLLAEKNWKFGGNTVVAITVNKNRVSVWVDEVKMLDYVDETPIISGKIGLYANDSTGAFERVSVHKIDVKDILLGDYSYDLVPEPIEIEPTNATFYVSLDGNDNWDGTLEKPFATIEKVIEEIRVAKTSNPYVDYTVMLRGGMYYLDDTIKMTSEDAGVGDWRVTYAAYPNETPIISGSGRLDNLIVLEGTKENPVKNIDFYGIGFSGTAENASEAALLYVNASANRIENCDFSMLGEAAIAFETGANSNLVYGNRFVDIGGCAVQIGCHQIEEENGDEGVPRGNKIENNYIDSATIWLGYTNHTIVKYNTIKNTSCSGIKVGWNGITEQVYSHNNRVLWNCIATTGENIEKVSIVGVQYNNHIANNYKEFSESEGNLFGCSIGKCGDANADKTVDILDLARMKKYEQSPNVKIDKIVSDVQSDNKINLKDVTKLRDMLIEDDVKLASKETISTYHSQVTGNPTFSEENLLYKSNISTSGNEETIIGICDGDTYPYDSGSDTVVPEEFIFTWDSSVTANTLRLYSNYAKDQAPAHLKIYVQQKNTSWRWISNCEISWRTIDGKYFEYVDIPIKAENITGIKVVVNEANLTWNHYVIAELELLFLESDKEGYKLVFADEFSDEDVDPNKWLTQYFPHATETPEGSKTTYKMEDGSLCLYIDENTPNFGYHTTMKASNIQTFEKNLLHPGAGETNWTEVEPYESFSCQYGYFEMRAKLPSSGGGGHVAWWLIGTQDDAKEDGTGSIQTGEIDILETTLLRTNRFNPKVHAWEDENLTDYENEAILIGDYSNEYHVYAMEWKPSGIVFFVDGKVVGTTSNSPKYRMAMFLGIYTDCGGWSGNANSVYPKEFHIDYIRVYQDINGYGQ